VDDVPPLGNDLEACITEAYFTKGGHLALHLKFVNGFTYDKTLVGLEIVLKNGEDEKIASGYSNKITNPDGSPYVIPATTDKENPKYTDLIFYISPEYILLPNDSLETLACDFKMDNTYNPPSDATTTGATTTAEAAA
jgi:hypothetical protein